MNRILDDGICNVCSKQERTATETKKANLPIQDLNQAGEVIETTLELKQAIELEEVQPDTKVRSLSLSRPGSPPAEYGESEKEIYLAEWEEYKGFYRDPTSKFILHSIIILQIELGWLLNEMTVRRGQPDKSQEAQRMRLVRSLKELRDQLPTKEANEESDDEKFLSMIYQKYAEECKERRLGKVARVLSPEAIALAPVLHFPINPQKLLTNLGYRLVDAAAACDNILLDDLPKEPEYVLEFFGFFLREKYSMPLDAITAEDEEPPLPSVANPANPANPSNPELATAQQVSSLHLPEDDSDDSFPLAGD